MNDIVFSAITRANAVACGAIGMGWLDLNCPKMAITMFVVGWIDPNWIELIGKKKETNNGNSKKRRSATKRTR
jgi:hypothetical protein